ncbi:MAG: chemotaxis protein CheW, partial [Ardenticatenales bacterium]|nr:chemotaxis protein CheW [Ardenticatenales bacterium]
PIATLFEKVPRLVRDIARETGKEVQLEIEGQGTELDRSVIESIGDPLRHLLRNAVDHGLEQPEERLAAGKPARGQIWLRAASVNGQIVVTVADDGRGIDLGRIRQQAVRQGLLSEERAAQQDEGELLPLLFLPGFSTREAVTTLSGRGVGLDVVRTSIERLSGSVVVESVPGAGTTFRLTLPLTLAIVQTMLIEVAEGMYALPLASVQQSMALGQAEQETVHGKAVLHWRESVMPLVDLRRFFGGPASGRGAVVVVRWGTLEVGLVVDRIVGQQETVVKPLSPLLGRVAGLSGSAILGDGRIALIVDIPTLLDRVLAQGPISKEQRAWTDK